MDADQIPPATTTPRDQADGMDDTDIVDIPWGNGFSYRGANGITRRERCKVILFAGTAHCGKTTLLSSLCLLYQRGPFAGYIFGGSRTLVGFEERNYYVRGASGGVIPTMERTKFAEVLHLRVRDQAALQPMATLLLCDLSGEDFREAKD